MPVPIEQRLAEKGWTKAEILKASSILHGKEDPGQIYFQKQLENIISYPIL